MCFALEMEEYILNVPTKSCSVLVESYRLEYLLRL